ncbi:MAG: hypothetical protein R3A52_23750 [Polyangiales bacterium]
MFLSVDGLRFRPMGTLDNRGAAGDDRCVASCVDWYGNTRPIFWRDRVFALMGLRARRGRGLDGRPARARPVRISSARRAPPTPARSR